MINRITEIMNDVSFGKTNGRMVSDKSYAYDTIFFIGNYIKNNLKISSDGRKYYAKSSEQLHEVKRYTQAIFKLNPHSDGSQNYFMETINLFIFSNIFSESEIDNNIVLPFLAWCSTKGRFVKSEDDILYTFIKSYK